MDDLSSSTSSDLITVNSSFASNHAALMDIENDESDAALNDLISQRERLVAELASEGGMDDTFHTSDLAGEANNESNPQISDGWMNDSMDADYAQAPADVEHGYSSDELFDDDQVDKLLEESLVNEAKAKQHSEFKVPADKEFGGLSQPPVVKSKVVLKRRGLEYFEVLPDGWIEVSHSSGVPVFLHKATRVCTFSRPYFLGPGSVRNHEVPISAIPCYYYRKLKDTDSEKKLDEEDSSFGSDMLEVQNSDDGGVGLPNMPKVKVQTVEDFKNRNISPGQLHDYCSSVFEFETINVMRFKSWSDQRTYYRGKQKQQQASTMAKNAYPGAAMVDGNTGRPTLPANVKLITVPEMEKGTKPQQKPFFLNPQGRTSIAVLHEYVQKVMKGNVTYEFSETRNAASPYCALVRIASHDRQRAGTGADSSGGGGQPVWTEYGKGEGNSKKSAKLNAAKQALRVLVPGIEFNADGMADLPQQDDAGKLFDLIKITDSRVPELSAKAGQPTPFIILQECLKRHSSFGDTTIDMNIKRIKHQQHEFTMKVAKHEVKVQCTNKKEGKQRAAQAMLEKLHPQISTWGSLIRLYGYGAQRKLQETKKEKDSIIRLQVQNKKQLNTHDEPNLAILEKLKQEMIKLYERGNSSDNAGSVDSNLAQISAVKNIDI